MWDNHRMLHILANGLFTLAALVAAFAIGPSVVNLPIFALKEVSADVKTNNQASIFIYSIHLFYESLISHCLL